MQDLKITFNKLVVVSMLSLFLVVKGVFIVKLIALVLAAAGWYMWIKDINKEASGVQAFKEVNPMERKAPIVALFALAYIAYFYVTTFILYSPFYVLSLCLVAIVAAEVNWDNHFSKNNYINAIIRKYSLS